ncbi:MAG: hypothetical protein QOD04_2440, partial [Pseudonocardiales bacterium]|nr:hypothetical protein [Pseudonocardiales bacterium]
RAGARTEAAGAKRASGSFVGGDAMSMEEIVEKGYVVVGSPDEVADRLNSSAEMLSADTNLIYIDMGGQPAGEFRDMVDLIGSRVIPQLD